jgi:hypothetical protein
MQQQAATTLSTVFQHYGAAAGPRPASNYQRPQQHGAFILRPGVTNPAFWHPKRLPSSVWEPIRKAVLQRDNCTCQSCGHRARKWMNVHHIGDSEDNALENLVTLCVACHAVMHLGFNLMRGTVAVFRAAESQVEIVQRTRAMIAQGMTLEAANRTFTLELGHYPPDAVEYANDLLYGMGDDPRAVLEEPLCAVFVDFNKWQIEKHKQRRSAI